MTTVTVLGTGSHSSAIPREYRVTLAPASFPIPTPDRAETAPRGPAIKGERALRADPVLRHAWRIRG